MSSIKDDEISSRMPKWARILEKAAGKKKV